MLTRPDFDWWHARARELGLTERSGQLEGPCPYCGGTDRFHVSRDPDGLFGCRRCSGFLEILKAAGFERISRSRAASIPDTPPPPHPDRPEQPTFRSAVAPASGSRPRTRTSVKPEPEGDVVSEQQWRFPMAIGGHVYLYRKNYANGAKEIARTKLSGDARRGPFLPYPGFDGSRETLIVEGPKSCDAARSMGLNSTCWFAAPADVLNTDWTAISSRQAILWPDNDDAGVACMRKLAIHLVRNLNFSLRLVQVSRLGPSEDIADIEPEAAAKLIERAIPFPRGARPNDGNPAPAPPSANPEDQP